MIQVTKFMTIEFEKRSRGRAKMDRQRYVSKKSVTDYKENAWDEFPLLKMDLLRSPSHPVDIQEDEIRPKRLKVNFRLCMSRISAVMIIVVRRTGSGAIAVADTIALQHPWPVSDMFPGPA